MAAPRNTGVGRVDVAAVPWRSHLIVALPYIYINVIQGDTPDRLAVVTAQAATDTTSAARAPRWTAWNVDSSSQAGYRVKEVLFGQSTEAVGRTTAVTGQAPSPAGRSRAARQVDLTR